MAVAQSRPQKGGFKLKSLPEDAYKGQQQRLKQNLIQNAKLKRNYAKILKVEGLTSTGKPSESDHFNAKQSDSSPAHTTEDLAFASFEEEEPSSTEASHTDRSELRTREAPSSDAKSYRQRVKARKADPAAIKAAAIKQDRREKIEQAKCEAAQLERKKAQRIVTNKRETSRTKSGQPRMKDRMKNLLEKIQG